MSMLSARNQVQPGASNYYENVPFSPTLSPSKSRSGSRIEGMVGINLEYIIRLFTRGIIFFSTYIYVG